METNMVDLYVAIIFGAIGGFGNCLLHYEGIVLPKINYKKNEQWSISLGFLPYIILGVFSSVLIYGLLGDINLPLKKAVALYLFCGIAGGNIITVYIQKKALELSKYKTESLLTITKELISKSELKNDKENSGDIR
jgi:hypothetical protein